MTPLLPPSLPATSTLFRRQDLAQAGLSARQIGQAVRQGRVERVGRGLYAAAAAAATERHTFAQVALRAPRATFCLLSALAFHHLTAENHYAAWLALPPHAWRPRLDFVPVEVVHVSGAALVEGVEQHTVEGVPVRVYGVAKTVADLFKFRHRVGTDVAVAALAAAWRERRCAGEELRRYAAVCRVERVMRPYLEAVALL